MTINLSRTLCTLGLAAALLGSAFSQGALARSAWTVDGAVTLPEVSVSAEADRAPTTTETSPALNFLERSGATGGDGQHA